MVFIKNMEPHALRNSMPVYWKVFKEKPEDQYENDYFLLTDYQDWAMLSRSVFPIQYRILMKARHNHDEGSKYSLIAEGRTREEILEDWRILITRIMPKILAAPDSPFDIDHLTSDFRRKKSKSEFSCTPAAPQGPGPNTKYIGEYAVLRLLGQGSFSKVKLGQHRLTKEEVAIKIISKEAGGELEVIRREIDILQGLHHRNVINVREVIETERHICIVQDYAQNGDLLEYINSNWAKNRAMGPDTKRLFHGIAEGIHYIHTQGVAHRDIKPTNVLLAAGNVPKLSDFGLSSQNRVLTTACGSPIYAAPELMNRQEYDGEKADVWGLGVVLYNMVTGMMPFGVTASTPIPQVYKAIITNPVQFPPGLAPECADLCRRMLLLDPKKRISSKDVLGHKWLEKERAEAQAEAERAASQLESSTTLSTDMLVQEVLGALELENWEFVKVEKDTQVYRPKKTPTNANIICVMTKGLVETDAESIVEYLRAATASRSAMGLDVSNKSVRVLQQPDDHTAIIHAIHRARAFLNFTKRARDLVFAQHTARLNNDQILLAIKSVKHPACPEQSGFVRGEVLPGGWLITPMGAKACMVQHIVTVDMKGNLSRDQARQLHVHYANATQCMREALRCARQSSSRNSSPASSPKPARRTFSWSTRPSAERTPSGTDSPTGDMSRSFEVL